MNILLCNGRLTGLTGGEMYNLELGSALKTLNHTVTLAGEETNDFFKNLCLEKHLLYDNLKNINNIDYYDYIIISNKEAVSKILNISRLLKYKGKLINICHSEIIEPWDDPLLIDNVCKYVAIRPPVKDRLIKKFKIDENKIQMIRNPIDLTRFNTQGTSNEKFGLFVGTMGGVRYKASIHFAQFCHVNNLKSVYISDENQQIPFFNVSLPSCKDIEKYFKSCSISGGVIHGRTYFEARLCGKPTVEYFIDNTGSITNIDYEDAPNENELISLRNQFDRVEVAKRIISL